MALAIAALIESRSRDLALSRAELVRRAGFKNIAKGMRRLDSLLAGDLETTRELIHGLATALGVPKSMVDRAFQETRRQIERAEQEEAEKQDAAWRAEFKPPAIIVTERTRPQPIFVAALIGVDNLLRLDFETGGNPLRFVKKAQQELEQRLSRWKGTIPAFGRPTGFVLNFSPDRAVRFDPEGNPKKIFNKAYRVGQVNLSLGGRPIPPGVLLGSVIGSMRVEARS
jgi:hypothetical protein